VALRGFYAGFNLTARSVEQRRAMVAELADLISRGILKAKIAATYPLTACKEAAAHAMKSGAERDGKVVFDLRL
jgi:NADPH:quinone reductase-like Zn-dependent oxidoreductase